MSPCSKDPADSALLLADKPCSAGAARRLLRWFARLRRPAMGKPGTNVINCNVRKEQGLIQTDNSNVVQQDHIQNTDAVKEDNMVTTLNIRSGVIDDGPSTSVAGINVFKKVIDFCESDFDDSDADKDWIPEPDDCDSEENTVIEKKRHNVLKAKGRATKEHSEETQNTEAGTHERGEVKRMSRKRKICYDSWKKNILKRKHNTGEAYITPKGNEVQEKKLQPACGPKCKQHCSSDISEEERKEALHSYWNMGDITLQRAFIVNCTTAITPRYKYVREGSSRKDNNAYYLIIRGARKRVCKKFFMATLNIGDRTIRTALLKGNRDLPSVEGDLRGKHGKHKCLDPDLVQRVCDHINSFPKVESHYLRKNTQREFLSRELTIAEMYRMFLKACSDHNIKPCKLSTYTNIFNQKFNIGFFVPKKDQCTLCEKYKNCNEDEKLAMQNEFNSHKRETELSRQEKQHDKDISKNNKDSTCVATYDLQAVLTTPSAQVSNFYYSRKFATYNLTIYNMGTSEGHCYLWNEDQAYRGPNEIGTCVYLFLKSNCIRKETIFYSDNCSGQQKNKYMACLYLYAVSNLDIPSITHKFLIVGHTQNEGDAMHSLIEKQKKRILKGGSIYCPQQWVTVIQNAKKNGKSFVVNELVSEDFIDVKKLAQNMGDNFTVNTDGYKVLWHDIKIIKVTKHLPNLLQYKTSFEQEHFLEIKLSSKTRSKKKQRSTLTLEKAFSESPGILEAKKKDLVQLCKSNLIPKSYHMFYEHLKTRKNATVPYDSE